MQILSEEKSQQKPLPKTPGSLPVPGTSSRDSVAKGVHCLSMEKTKVKCTCVLVLEVQGQECCIKSPWGPWRLGDSASLFTNEITKELH